MTTDRPTVPDAPPPNRLLADRVLAAYRRTGARPCIGALDALDYCATTPPPLICCGLGAAYFDRSPAPRRGPAHYEAFAALGLDSRYGDGWAAGFDSYRIPRPELLAAFRRDGLSGRYIEGVADGHAAGRAVAAEFGDFDTDGLYYQEDGRCHGSRS